MLGLDAVVLGDGGVSSGDVGMYVSDDSRGPDTGLFQGSMQTMQRRNVCR